MASHIRSIAELDFATPAGVWPSPRDWRHVFIYFLLVDRFDDNNKDTLLTLPPRRRAAETQMRGESFKAAIWKGSPGR